MATMHTPEDGSVMPVQESLAAVANQLAQRFAEFRHGDAARRMLGTRSALVMALRRELHDLGHVEVDTPLLQTCAATSERSFRTMTHSLDPNTYLRSSPFFLRAMLTTGVEKVFEIGRTFRDEPVDGTHSPEYSLVELYQAGADYHSLRAVAQSLITAAAVAVLGRTTVRSRGGQLIDLAGEWRVRGVYDAVGEAIGQPVLASTDAALLRRHAAQHLRMTDDELTADELILELYDRLVEPATIEPTFYINFPASQSPLAEACTHDSRLAQKWDLVIDGREIGTGYTELADSDELTRRLNRLEDDGRPSEGVAIDPDWVEVFTAGMPQSGGLCLGLERVLLTVTGARTIRDVIPFPMAHWS